MLQQEWQLLWKMLSGFEDHMPFAPEHKKNEVVGITYNVVNVAGEAGDASPSTPIGVNLLTQTGFVKCTALNR